MDLTNAQYEEYIKNRETQLVAANNRIEIQLQTIDRLNEKLKAANSAYQRIFDEKAARCAYIAKLEKCNDKQRELIKRLEAKTPPLEIKQEFDCSPVEQPIDLSKIETLNYQPDQIINCIKQEKIGDQVLCRDSENSEFYGLQCSTRCKSPTPKVEDDDYDL